jgi:hypothetical protein
MIRMQITSAKEILRQREELKAQKMKENIEQINKEMLEFEKALNVYKKDIENTKPYIELPLIIKSQEVKDLLGEGGYIIDRISGDIKVNTTRIYLDEESYRQAVSQQKSNYINTSIQQSKTEDTKLDNNDIDFGVKEVRIPEEYAMKYLINEIKKATRESKDYSHWFGDVK